MGSYDQFYVKPCASGSMCPDTTILSTQTCSVTNLNTYAGAKCPSGTTCSLDASSPTPTHCVKGVCQGIAKNGSCTNNSDCNAGLYCANNVCVSQLAEGSTCTQAQTYGNECANNMVCTVEFKCKKMFQQGTEDDCRADLECKSGFCASDGKCYKAESDHSAPHKCSTASGNSSECVSKKVHGNTINGRCECGKNPDGHLYCSQLQYDYYGKKYFEKVADIADEKWLMNCNIAATDGLDACVRSYASKDDMEEYFYYKQQYNNYPEFVNADSCVADTYNPTFNDADDDYAEDSDFAAALILPLFFGLI